MPYLTSAVSREITFPGAIASGTRGMRAKQVQEWLCFHGCGTAIDSQYGPGTERAVKAFQGKVKLPATGKVDQKTWDALVKPLVNAVSVVLPRNARLDEAVLTVARAHLALHPIELGGDNCGPWVRAYTGGYEGPEWRWCAAFVSFIIRQACEGTGKPAPIAGSPSCDSLAGQARQNGRFVEGRALESGKVKWSGLGQCQVFLVRRTSTDWVHTGYAFEGNGGTFATIEGNTNDEGSPNGFEVCRRSRSLAGKDFITLF